MSFTTVSVVSENEQCRVTVARDPSNSAAGYETVIEVFDHELVRRVLGIYEAAADRPDVEPPRYVSSGGKHYFVFPWVKARPLSIFYMGTTLTLAQSEEICKNLIISCMTCGMPWPLLYLALSQDKIHLAADRSVSLSWDVDLSKISAEITESDCVVLAAEILLSLFSPRADRRADSYRLLSMKSARRSYTHFTELYRDLEISGLQERRRGLFAGIGYWISDHRDDIFRWLLRIAVVLLIFTVITLLTNAFFGDVPWLRLFIRSFEQIGTESLLQ